LKLQCRLLPKSTTESSYVTHRCGCIQTHASMCACQSTPSSRSLPAFCYCTCFAVSKELLMHLPDVHTHHAFTRRILWHRKRHDGKSPGYKILMGCWWAPNASCTSRHPFCLHCLFESLHQKLLDCDMMTMQGSCC